MNWIISNIAPLEKLDFLSDHESAEKKVKHSQENPNKSPVAQRDVTLDNHDRGENE